MITKYLLTISTILISLFLFSSFNQVAYSLDKTGATDYQKFLKAIDKVNQTGDKSITKVNDSVKSLDIILEALSDYYKKASKTKGQDQNIITLIQLSQSRSGLAHSYAKSSEKSIKIFQRNDRKGQGDLDKLRTDLEPLILAFSEYKTTLSELIDAIQVYHDAHPDAKSSPNINSTTPTTNTKTTATPTPKTNSNSTQNNNSE